MSADLITILRAAAHAYGDRPALTERSGRSVTHAQLQARYLTLAQGLIDRGFRAGDRMLLAMPPSMSTITVALACAAAGGSVFTTHPNLTSQAFAERWNAAEPTWVAADSVAYALSRPGPALAMAKLRGLTLADLSQLPARHIHSGPWLPGVPRSAVSFKSLMGGRHLAEPVLGDEVVIVFTSSGRDARAVAHSADSVGAMVTLTAETLGLRPSDRVFTDQLMLGLATLGTGAHWLLPSSGYLPRFEPRRFGAEIGDATVFHASPTDLVDIAEAVARGELEHPSRLRSVVTGAAAVTPDAIRKASILVEPQDIHCVYGTTELIPIAVTTGAEVVAHSGDGAFVGRPSPGLQWRLDGRGELSVTGPSVARRYLPDTPIEWVKTGDIVREQDGGFVLLGRVGDEIVRQGQTVYPAAVEQRLSSLTGFTDVAAVGVQDAVGSNSLVLAVVPEGINTELFSEPAVLSDMWLPPDLNEQLDQQLEPAARPDRIIAVSCIPRTGRPQLIDRRALGEIVRPVVHAGASHRTA